MKTDFRFSHVSSTRDGGRQKKPRPGEVSLNDGDVTTHIYSLEGSTLVEFLRWADAVFCAPLSQAHRIVGDYPHFQVERAEAS